MYCDYEQLNAGTWGKSIDLNDVLDAKPDGFKMKFQYTSIGLKNTGIAFSSAETANNFFGDRWPRYKIGKLTNAESTEFLNLR